MDKVIYSDKEYKIIHNNKSYILIKLDGDYEQHAHFKKNSTCHLIIKLIRNKIVPKSKYLQNAVMRISKDEKYTEKILIKQQKNRNKSFYVNVNKGGSVIK